MGYENSHSYCSLEADKFQPLGRRILVQWEEKKKDLLGGKLVLPETQTRQHYTGIVIKVGKSVSIDIEEGDRIAFEQFSGFEKFFDKKYGRLALIEQGACYSIIPKRLSVENGEGDFMYDK